MEVNTQVTGTEIQEKGDFSRENTRDAIWTTIMVTVEVNLVELSLFKGTAREQQLATAQVTARSCICVFIQAHTLIMHR
jgi:hypothetical protein